MSASRFARAALLAFLMSLTVAAGVAHAGSYTVYTCDDPKGAPAPIGDSETGWRPALRASTSFTFLTDECRSGAGIRGRLTGAGGAQPRGAGAEWRFIAPPGTSIRGFEVDWSGSATNGGEVALSRSDQPDPTYVRRYSTAFGPERVVVRDIDIASLGAIIACSFADPCPAAPDIAEFTIASARFTLGDDAAARVTGVSGPFVDRPQLQGRVPVSLSAEDAGGGVFRAIVVVDGQDALTVPLAGDERCRDADPTDGDAFQFVVPRPCPAAVGGSVEIDTSALPAGRHAVSLVVQDAAGNRTVAYGPVEKDIVRSAGPGPAGQGPAERGPVNGAGGGDGAVFTARSRRIRKVGYGRSRVVLTGTLAREGRPVAGALLELLSQRRVIRAPLERVGEVRTDERGRFVIRAPNGPSRLLRIGYRAHVNDAEPATRLDTILRVAAGIRLKAQQRRIGLRGTARFTGRLLGGDVPRRGKLVTLQAFDRGRWREVSTRRTNRRGAYRFAYRFRTLRRRTSYRFRVRSRYEVGYPYVLGTSRPVRVTVG